jgi:hypothetical protein
LALTATIEERQISLKACQGKLSSVEVSVGAQLKNKNAGCKFLVFRGLITNDQLHPRA